MVTFLKYDVIDTVQYTVKPWFKGPTYYIFLHLRYTFCGPNQSFICLIYYSPQFVSKFKALPEFSAITLIPTHVLYAISVLKKIFSRSNLYVATLAQFKETFCTACNAAWLSVPILCSFCVSVRSGYLMHGHGVEKKEVNNNWESENYLGGGKKSNCHRTKLWNVLCCLSCH
jgi:hypothetical protein